MKRDDFDRFARALAGSFDRRRFMVLTAFGLSAVHLAHFDVGETDARKKKKRKRRRKKQSTAETGVQDAPTVPNAPACVPDCLNKECGADGCGGVCGDCGFLACISGVCKLPCIPDCAGKICGPDGCGGECQPGCLNVGEFCSPWGDSCLV